MTTNSLATASLTTNSVKLVDPTGADPGLDAWSLAPRPADLRGKRVGLLDNSKANSDVLLRAIADILNSEFEFADVFYVKKHSASLPPTPEVMAALHRNADLIITGIGD
jgi:hypothetical protein